MKNQRLVGFDTAISDAYRGPSRELTVDTDRNELRLHDGITTGGIRVLNESQLAAFSSLLFTAVSTIGLIAAQALDNTHVRRLINVTSVGGPWTLSLPDLADFDVGAAILVRAASAGVQLSPASGEGWIKGTVDEVDGVYTIPNGQIVTLAKMSPTRFIFTNIQ